MYGWQEKNPFHVHEFTAEEFIGLIEMYFGELSLFSQAEEVYPRYAFYSMALRALKYLKLKDTVKKLLGWKSPPSNEPRILRKRRQRVPWHSTLPELLVYMSAVFDCSCPESV